jgi:fibronectin-binding autotransporter adhesin
VGTIIVADRRVAAGLCARRTLASLRAGLLASACVTSAFVTSTSAQTAWTDGTGDWFNAGNWSAGVPTVATPQTTVSNGGTAQIAGAAANAGTLLVINGGSTVDLQAGGSLTASGITVDTNGTLLLSGSTAVTGPLTLDGGTLRSTLSGTLTNAVTIDAGFSATFAATGGQTLTLASTGLTSFLGGAGTTVHFGSATDTGTVVLAPTNTAAVPAGAGAVDGGTLKIGSVGGSDLIFTFQERLTVGSGTTAATLDLNGFSTFAWNLTGTSAGTITNSGAATTLTTRTAATSTFAGVIQDGASGSGGMSVHVSSAVGGPGTLILTGANTYTGGTTIDAFQTLQIGNGGASGSIVGNVVNNGTLAIDRSGTLLLAGNISGAGAFQQIGPGTTILSGTNTYTGNTAVLGGTLQLGNGGASGSIIGDVVNNGTLAINRSDTYTFGGVISGAGAFAQIGTGTTILTAANTYTCGTTISSGTLQLGNGGSTGALVGSVTNNATFDIVNADTSGITAITNNGLLRFFNANTAGNAAITNDFSTQFSDASNAGNATITNNRGLSFLGTSSAGTATIVTNNGGTTAFFAGSIGGLARLITNAGAAVDISGLTTAGMTAGSIEGAGNYFLGSKQ